MLNELLTTEVKLPLAAVRLLEPIKSMLKLPKVALPVPSVFWLVVPLSVPAPLRVIVTETPALGTLFPKVSSSCTVTAGAMAAPAVAAVGCWTKANWLAAAGEMLNEPLMAGVNAPLAALRVFPPLRLMLKLLKVG